MMQPEIDYMVQMERRKDEMRAADQARLVRMAAEQVKPHGTMRLALVALTLALAFLGERMLDWSARLQCRYRILAAGSETQPEPCA